MSHVGCHYDLEVDGRPMRIVCIGQEYGQSVSCVDLKERYQMISKYAPRNFNDRSKHMGGVTSTLRLLLGREPGLDKEGEQLFPGTHIFDGFALVNYLLCSVLKERRDPSEKGGGKGNSSATMKRKCIRHLMKTLEILEPTVIVVHGKGVSKWLANKRLLLGENCLRTMRVNESWTDALVFEHPSSPGKGSWGVSTNSRYLRECVTPVINSYLRKR